MNDLDQILDQMGYTLNTDSRELAYKLLTKWRAEGYKKGYIDGILDCLKLKEELNNHGHGVHKY